ncbi:5147_t:CDS:10 [Diversispora eburnea]|uniref:5147_t:CDS:1 n=1 Tax=Diversispora eburnea TaxID=1213867 RepID=A0A9N9GBS6_9GLOM|nr:5147_t:CDS:10 [Diversispora eburnea]
MPNNNNNDIDIFEEILMLTGDAVEHPESSQSAQAEKKTSRKRRRGGNDRVDNMYRDDDDRDRLENLNELEREKILSERAEKRQHNKDLEAVHLLFNPDDARSTRAKGSKKKGRDLEELKRRRAQRGQRTITEIKLEDIKQVQLTRRHLGEWMFAPHFENTVVGCFVRLHIGVSEGKQIYRVCEIEAVEEINSTYYVEKCITNQVLRLRHADAVKTWHMHCISNSEFDQSEFDRWIKTMKSQNISLPLKEEVLRKRKDIQDARGYVLSEQDVESIVRKKQSLRGGEPIDLFTQKTTLVTQKNMAEAQGNFKEAQDCAARLNEIDKLIGVASRDTKQDTWARVNERNRLKNLEDSRLAEEIARQKKKAEVIPRKSVKTGFYDSPSHKEEEKSYRFAKALKAPFTQYEALIYDADVELKLPPNPNFSVIDSENEIDYASFTIEKSLSLIRGLHQNPVFQPTTDITKPQELTSSPPPHEETSNSRYRSQPQPESSKGSKQYKIHKDLHYVPITLFTMRSICLFDRVKFSFPGNMNPHAFAFGDVDNDQDNEFIIGNLKGELGIFKGTPEKGRPVITGSKLGTITCVAIGDVKNSGKNSIVCVNAEGVCHIFDITNNDFGDGKPPSLNIKGYPPLMVPVNCNRILISDIDGDGMNEIILARTDRILHVYNVEMGLNDQQPNIEKLNLNDLVPHLTEKKKWSFDGQITSMATAKDPKTSEQLLLIGQPGGHFIIIEKNEKKIFPTQFPNDISHSDDLIEVSTEIVSGIKWENEKCSDIVALVTMDGKFTFFDLQTSKPIRHELQVTHKLFGMASMDLYSENDSEQNIDDELSSNKRNDVFVACAWDGHTYVIDYDFNVVRFEFEGRVCAFAAGQYALTKGHNVPCFMYVDFEDHITVYHNLHINTKPVTNFIEIMRDQIDEFDGLLKENVKNYEHGLYQSTPHITDFFHNCLYKSDDYERIMQDLERKINEVSTK